jgi:hypothetical protein
VEQQHCDFVIRRFGCGRMGMISWNSLIFGKWEELPGDDGGS